MGQPAKASSMGSLKDSGASNEVRRYLLRDVVLRRVTSQFSLQATHCGRPLVKRAIVEA